MSHNNESGKFFKFKNLQLVRKPNTVRQTRQNTDLRTQGTAEEQFAAITATACADALREIDNISIKPDTPINVYTRFCLNTAKSKFSLVSPVADW